MSMEILPSIAFQVTLLLLIAVGGYLIASWFHQSTVVGEILLGLVFGPSILGLITYTDFVSGLAEMGAIIMLFVIGFDFHFKDLLNRNYFFIGVCGVVLPWIGGFLLASYWGFDTAASLFIGTALTATSIAITANVLKEMGQLHTRAANAIIGTAVVDDILSLIVLSMVIDVAEGAELSIIDIIISFGKPIVFIIAAGLIAVYGIDKVLGAVDRTEFAAKYPEFVFLTALFFAFLYAFAAEFFGLSSVIGAFIAGVAFNRIGLTQSKSIKAGSEFLYVPVAAMFFVSLGILVDLHDLAANTLGFLVILTVVAVLTKLLGCSIPAWILGMKRRDALTVGLGMVPRGEMTMIVALMGVGMGLISKGIFSAIVIMGLLTAIISPILLRDVLFHGAPEELSIWDKDRKHV